jgi:hypothetical protein
MDRRIKSGDDNQKNRGLCLPFATRMQNRITSANAIKHRLGRSPLTGSERPEATFDALDRFHNFDILQQSLAGGGIHQTSS